jgi:hypothetical protein
METKCKTIFIATDGKAPITHNDIEEGLFHNPMSILAKHRADKCTNMHLYVLGNADDLKIGDWVVIDGVVQSITGFNKGVLDEFIMNYGNTLSTCCNVTTERFVCIPESLKDKKIIATTNRELKVFFNERTANCIYEHEKEFGLKPLANISTAVIQLCIAEYNIGNKSVELEVEYEEGWLKDWEEENKKRQGSWADERVVKLKVDPKDNTILIKNFKAPKENFTAEEVKFIATRFAHACRLKEVVTNKETCELFDKWFKEINKSL